MNFGKPIRDPSPPPFGGRPWAALFSSAIFAAMLFHPGFALAIPTDEDIVRSFNENMNAAPDYSRMIPWILAAIGAVVIVICFRNWQKRQAVPRKLNHPMKLVREIARNIEIAQPEMKKMMQLARELDCDNPLTVMLCPSLTGEPSESKHS